MRLTSSSRSTVVPLVPDHVWSVVACGEAGPRWYADTVALRFRGGLDRLVGGRGDHTPPPGRALLEPGDEAGLWRVLRADGHVLDLEATVWSPGTVTLRTSLEPSGSGTRVNQRVTFRPAGLLGVGYLLADLPARETVVHPVHRRLLRDLHRPAPTEGD